MSCGGCVQSLNTASIHTTTNLQPAQSFLPTLYVQAVGSFHWAGCFDFMSIQPKPNTYYKTRDGRKAFVGFRIPGMNRSCPWVGRIDACVYTWVENGSYRLDSESPEDLIAEWSEPKLRPWRPEEVPVGAWYRDKGSRNVVMIIAYTPKDAFPIRFVSWTNSDRISGDSPEEALEAREHSTDGGKTWLPCGMME